MERRVHAVYGSHFGGCWRRSETGETGRELCETLIPSSLPDQTVDWLMPALDGHCSPNVNETVKRYRFFVRNQSADENIDKYVTDLRMFASTCNFVQIKDSLTCNRIVCGITSSGLRERDFWGSRIWLWKNVCNRVVARKQQNNWRVSGRGSASSKTFLHMGKKKFKNCGKDNHFAAMCRTKMQKGKTVHAITD